MFGTFGAVMLWWGGVSGGVLAILGAMAWLWKKANPALTTLCKAMVFRANLERTNAAQISDLRQEVGDARVEVKATGAQGAIGIDQNKVIMDFLGVAYMQTDASGATNAVSDAWCELSGSQRDDVLREGWFGTVQPQDQQQVIDVMSDAFVKGRARDVEFTFNNGQVARASTSPIRHGGVVIAHRIIVKGLWIDKPVK